MTRAAANKVRPAVLVVGGVLLACAPPVPVDRQAVPAPGGPVDTARPTGTAAAPLLWPDGGFPSDGHGSDAGSSAAPDAPSPAVATDGRSPDAPAPVDLRPGAIEGGADGARGSAPVPEAPPAADGAPGGPRDATSGTDRAAEAAATPSRALLVTENATLDASDSLLRRRLESLGMIVDVVPDEIAGPEHATGHDVVAVVMGVTTSLIATRLRDVAAGVLVLEPKLYDDMGMTEQNQYGVGAGREVAIVEAAHPIAAGLGGTVPIATATTTMGWGLPGPGAIRIASMSGAPAQAAIFAYDRGAPLRDRPAPGRRVGWFASPAMLGKLALEGQKLLDAALLWAAGR